MSLAMAVVYDHDYCLHAKCADNADCTKIQFGHNCKCRRGFKGDGVNFCVDIEIVADTLSDRKKGFHCFCPDGTSEAPYAISQGCYDFDEGR